MINKLLLHNTSMIREFLAKLFGKKKKVDADIQPIIPDHRKEKLLEQIKTVSNKTSTKKQGKLVEIDIKEEVALFEVDGVYSVGNITMITGLVESGRVKRKMKTIVNELQIRVDEVRKDGEKVPSLLVGQKGTILIKSKGKPLLRKGDFLDFK